MVNGLTNFEELLKSIDGLDDKKARLWSEIYANAIDDRDSARELLEHVTAKILSDPTNHVAFGLNASKYVERMSRANDQLLKLAELIENAQKPKEEDTSPDKLYDLMKVG